MTPGVSFTMNAANHQCVLAGCQASAGSSGLCQAHQDAWQSVLRGADPRRYQPPAASRLLRVFDEASRRVKAAWRALRYGVET